VLTTSALKKKEKASQTSRLFPQSCTLQPKKNNPLQTKPYYTKKKHTGFQLSINISPSKKKKDVPSSHEKTRKELQNI